MWLSIYILIITKKISASFSVQEVWGVNARKIEIVLFKHNFHYHYPSLLIFINLALDKT